MVRDHNEDSAFMEPSRGVFVVADGMGGHAAGEVASAMAVETVRKTLERSRTEIDAFKAAPTDSGRRGIVQLLQNAVQSAHEAVFRRGQEESDKQGMGTTLDVVLVVGPEAFVAHVGDSRTYLIRDGRSSQITTDHTVAEVLVIEGKLTIEEAQVSPLRTILVNAIGVSPDVAVEMAHVTLKRGDRLLLCSDGLHDYFPVEEEIAQRLGTGAAGAALQEMVDLAKSRGGHDNITGVAVQVVDVHDGSPKAVETEPTQPVDLQGNPFFDESNEAVDTAVMPAPKAIAEAAKPPGELVKPGRSTQPLRAVGDDPGRADTIPPDGQDAKARGAGKAPRAPTPPKGVAAIPATATIPPVPATAVPTVNRTATPPTGTPNLPRPAPTQSRSNTPAMGIPALRTPATKAADPKKSDDGAEPAAKPDDATDKKGSG
ncbi:MAG: protein phosphatase 2C domain-containing protein [Kofleriaceae bacterium]